MLFVDAACRDRFGKRLGLAMVETAFLDVYRLAFALRYSLFAIRYSLFVIRYSGLAMRASRFAIRASRSRSSVAWPFLQFLKRAGL